MHPTRSSRPLTLALAAVVFATALPAAAQVFVVPRRPNKNVVHTFDFQWQTIDIAVKPDHAMTDGGVAELVAPDSGTPDGGLAEYVGLDGGTPIVEPVLLDGGMPDGGLAEAETDAGVPDGGLAEAPLPPIEQPQGPYVPGQPVTPSNVNPPTGQEGTPRERPVETDTEATHFKVSEYRPKPLDWAHSGGVRLYFYAHERKIATYAAASIVNSYRDLAEHSFYFVPPRIFPYILYSSYQEFLQTNLFPLQEGVLGVTSPLDLKLTLPYLGDDQMFERISRHEMSHQFTFQKTQWIAKQHHLGTDPSEAMPLWFVEGLAEFYAQHGIDPEAEMLARDLVTNPDLELGYALLDFYEDRPGSVLWTYKLGQVRCGFLEETYGHGFIQRVLEASPALVAGGFLGVHGAGGFQHLIEQLTGDDEETVTHKFSEWIKKRAYTEYLSAAQFFPDVRVLRKFESEPNALASSPDGNLLIYRTFNEVTGQTKLVMVDRRDPGDSIKLAEDGVPGVESLHPVFPRNFDLDERSIVYSAEQNGRDILYWRDYVHRARPLPKLAPRAPQTYDVSIATQGLRAYELSKQGVIAALSPSLSPDGRKVAFIGLDTDGQRDVYVFEPNGETQFTLTRLTHDIAAERELSWGPSGILFTSDNTALRKFNLFRVQADQPDQVERLTDEDRDEEGPRELPDGRVLFTAYDHARSNLYERTPDGAIVMRSDVPTGVFSPNPGPEGGIWTLFLHSGRRQPALFTKTHLLSLTVKDVEKTPGNSTLPQLSLADSARYKTFDIMHNWEPGTPFAFLGGGSGGIFGTVFASASDKLNNHAVLINASLYGSFKLTDGYLLYLDQSQRATWGMGLFQSLNFRLDETFPQVPLLFTSIDRFYGVLGTVRYPFNRFTFVQADASLGGVSYALEDASAYFLADPNLNFAGRDLLNDWYVKNPGPRIQAQLSLQAGYDTIQYGGIGGVSGNSLLLEGTIDVQPQPKYGNVFGTIRMDAEQFFQISGLTHMFTRLGAGTSLGGRLAQQFYLSTFDTLRGVPFGNTSWILGKEFVYTTTELRLPMNSLFRFFLFQYVEGVLGVDAGGVGNDPSQVWDKRVLDVAIGVNAALGPIILRLHFAKNIDIGAHNPVLFGASVPDPGWVTNFSVGYLGLGVYGLGGRPAAPTTVNSPHGVF